MRILPWLLGGMLTYQLALFFSRLSNSEVATQSSSLETIYSVVAMAMSVLCIISMSKALAAAHKAFHQFSNCELSDDDRAMRSERVSLIQFEENK